MRKRTANSMALCLVLVLPVLLMTTSAPAIADSVTGFRDVPEGYEHAADIATLVRAGIITGFPDGTFRPTARVTRRQMAAMLNRIHGDVFAPNTSVTATRARVAWFAFTWQDATFDFAIGGNFEHGDPGPLPRDVRNHRFAYEIGHLINQGVIRGYADGTFRPDRPVTRAQAAAIIMRVQQFTGNVLCDAADELNENFDHVIVCDSDSYYWVYSNQSNSHTMPVMEPVASTLQMSLSSNRSRFTSPRGGLSLSVGRRLASTFFSGTP
jgi:hypothetical protein